jgi:sec-independent protein translocase protein TatA
MLAFVGIPGIHEMIIIALVLIFFFGAKKIPDLMKGIGKGVKEYKDVMKEVNNEIDDLKKIN